VRCILKSQLTAVCSMGGVCFNNGCGSACRKSSMFSMYEVHLQGGEDA